jgi:DNA-binding transcriptional MocR family regulator
VLIDPGDPVVVADPDYLGATQAFRRAGADLATLVNHLRGSLPMQRSA